MEKTWLYLKKIKEQKKSFLDILIFGLFFEIAWIIPGIDIFSFITPITNSLNIDNLPLPFQAIKLFTSPIIDSLNPCILPPFWGFITSFSLSNSESTLSFVILGILVFLSAIISVFYIFFHCKIYNVLLKIFLNPDKKLNIGELYSEKLDYLKKYYNWELICFGIKFIISLPFFIWCLFFNDISFSDKTQEFLMLISIIVYGILLLIDLYIILTRAFVLPVFMSGKYQEINAKSVFLLSKKIFSIKLIVPTLILITVYILANFIVLSGTVGLFILSSEYISIFILKFLLWIFGVVILAIFTYYVGIFCLSYCVFSCQKNIFPDCPLILTKMSENGNIEDVLET